MAEVSMQATDLVGADKVDDGIVQVQSHQRSWWIVSYSAYIQTRGSAAESHQRSWWIVHIEPCWACLQSGAEL